MEGDDVDDINYFVDCDYRYSHKRFFMVVWRFDRIRIIGLGSHQARQISKEEMSPITRALSLCV